MSNAADFDPTDRFHVLLKQVVQDVKIQTAASAPRATSTKRTKPPAQTTINEINIGLKRSADNRNATALTVTLTDADHEEAKKSGIEFRQLVSRRHKALLSRSRNLVLRVREANGERIAIILTLHYAILEGSNPKERTEAPVRPSGNHRRSVQAPTARPKARAPKRRRTVVAANYTLSTAITVTDVEMPFMEPPRFTERDPTPPPPPSPPAPKRVCIDKRPHRESHERRHAPRPDLKFPTSQLDDGGDTESDEEVRKYREV